MKIPSHILHHLLGIVLISIFAFSVMPSSVFHNMLAHHTDETIQHRHTHTHEVANAGINCHWDNLVCEGSYLNSIAHFSFHPPVCRVVYKDSFYKNFFSQHHFYAELRGPPAAFSFA